MSEADYSLVLPFDSDDREFVRGFQMGMVYARFAADDERGDVIVYPDCAEMLVRMQERGWQFDVLPNGDDSLVVTVREVRRD